jgi:D-3-phosphoglycerate dehydrogenase
VTIASIIVSGDSLGDDVAEQLKAAGHDVVRGPRPDPPRMAPVLPPERWDEARDAAVIVVSPRDAAPRELIDAAPGLRGIVSLVIGVDTIDVEAAHERGLIVAHGAMEENYLGVSEGVVMLTAALLLELRAKERWLREGVRSERIPGTMVRGKTIGLVGMGRSARGVVERLRGWEVEILAHDPYVDSATVPPGVTMAPLADVLRLSDVVSVHTTLDADTRHLIADAELAAMKPDAYLINLSRGPVVDEAALARALATGQIRGAAIDVFEQEPLPADSPLRDLENVILTPHCVGHSRELLAAVTRVGCENAERVLRGERPVFVKSPPDVTERWLGQPGSTAQEVRP